MTLMLHILPFHLDDLLLSLLTGVSGLHCLWWLRSKLRMNRIRTIVRDQTVAYHNKRRSKRGNTS